MEIYKALELKLRQYYKYENLVIIKKSNLLPIGILFCTSNNVEQIILVFDIFKNEDEEFTKYEELNNYLLSLFLTGSYCLLSDMNKVRSINEEVGKIEKKDLLKVINVSEVKD